MGAWKQVSLARRRRRCKTSVPIRMRKRAAELGSITAGRLQMGAKQMKLTQSDASSGRHAVASIVAEVPLELFFAARAWELIQPESSPR